MVGREGEDLGGWKCFMMRNWGCGRLSTTLTDTRVVWTPMVVSRLNLCVLCVIAAIAVGIGDMLATASSRCNWRKLLKNGGVVHKRTISV